MLTKLRLCKVIPVDTASTARVLDIFVMGDLLVSTSVISFDKTAAVFSVSSITKLATFRAHQDTVFSVAIRQQFITRPSDCKAKSL